MFTLVFTESFDKNYQQIVKGNLKIEKKVRKALYFLEHDPHHPSLKTHKANTKNYGEKWSSWVTGDIRIIWDYDTAGQLVIILLDMGKHSGSHKMYK